jgi:predicted CopG family antitoxin
LLYNLYKITMPATKRVAVTQAVWAKLSDLRRPGETFSQLLAEMIEREKKARLIERLKQIADEGDFVELPP